MQGGVNYNGNTLLTGGINVNTTGNIQALNVQVTENGERTITPPEGVDGYAPITIDTNVPIPEPVLDTLNVTSNGTYTPPSGVDGYDVVNVNVPQPTPVLDDITITANGTYTPPSGVDGYDEITVNVSQDADIQPLTRTITTNGTTVINASDLNIDGFDPVTITTAVDGYTIKTIANTPIASFNDGTSNPLKSLTASIVPVQAGSGDPSPTNVRPITGWTEEVVNLCGKNLLKTRTTDGSSNNVTVTVNKDLNDRVISFTASGKSTGNANINLFNGQIDIPSDSYIFSITNSLTISGGSGGIYLSTETGREGTRIATAMKSGSTSFTNKLGTVWLYVSNGATVSGTISIMLRKSSVLDDTFEPYNGTTTTIPFVDGQGQSVEVYGGEIDVINGVVTPCPYYASYNGEQLTGEWISDRDVYSPNTTPTIGAQVVNIGATGTPFYTQPTSIKSLDVVNNVSASTGDVEELKYFADL